jgi:hypothetical protein
MFNLNPIYNDKLVSAIQQERLARAAQAQQLAQINGEKQPARSGIIPSLRRRNWMPFQRSRMASSGASARLRDA